MKMLLPSLMVIAISGCATPQTSVGIMANVDLVSAELSKLDAFHKAHFQEDITKVENQAKSLDAGLVSDLKRLSNDSGKVDISKIEQALKGFKLEDGTEVPGYFDIRAQLQGEIDHIRNIANTASDNTEALKEALERARKLTYKAANIREDIAALIESYRRP